VVSLSRYRHFLKVKCEIFCVWIIFSTMATNGFVIRNSFILSLLNWLVVDTNVYTINIKIWPKSSPGILHTFRCRTVLSVFALLCPRNFYMDVVCLFQVEDILFLSFQPLSDPIFGKYIFLVSYHCTKKSNDCSQQENNLIMVTSKIVWNFWSPPSAGISLIQG